MSDTLDRENLMKIEHSFQRKAAIAWGGGTDHVGNVYITPIKDFDLNNTIFSTLEGTLPRMFMEAKIAKTVFWNENASGTIEQAYRATVQEKEIPAVNPEIIRFMEEECDFSAEHADGTFLEHLLFCYDYSAIHFPSHSPMVMLLHSILGTGTNTFAMVAEKIPVLAKLIDEEDMQHIEAFPSFLRLLYQPEFLGELEASANRLDKLESVSFHRVIDNQRLTMAAEHFWSQLNYQLIHYVDFLPAANWEAHFSDPVMQSFIDLSVFLDKVNKRSAQVGFPIPTAGKSRTPEQEALSVGGRLSSFVPASVKKKLAAKSIRRFSERINHSLDFEFTWSS
jgi:hypothetical protein